MKRAILSVSDKTGIIELATALLKANYELISTGGTATLLKEKGMPVTAIEEITNFPECMDGRLKTLHPSVFGGLLGILDNPEHIKTMETHHMKPIDILVTNLYPFRKTVENPSHTLQNAIENIDIGGPSMIRAAAKNHKYVCVLTSPSQYDELINNLDNLDEKYRFKLASEAFNYTAAYDAYIAEYLRQVSNTETFPQTLTITYDKHETPMRYGENPHQQAAYYTWPQNPYYGIEKAELLHGKPLSFNNIADAHATLAVAKEFSNQPVCVAVKHATPCGVATGKTILDAYNAAYDCDPQSIFGGIICVNRELDEATAKEMHKTFLEVIIAPSFTADALGVLTKKKNLRLLALKDMYKETKNSLECKSVGGGILFQQPDEVNIETETHKTVTEKTPTKTDDLIFAMKVVKHVKSNAIVVAKNGCTIGIGGGEVSRVWAAEAAISRAGDKAKDAVLASDALFPFPDVVELCAKAGIKEIIQPGGSVNDQLSIDAANNHGLAMVFTDVRHFKH